MQNEKSVNSGYDKIVLDFFADENTHQEPCLKTDADGVPLLHQILKSGDVNQI